MEQNEEGKKEIRLKHGSLKNDLFFSKTCETWMETLN